MGDARVNWILPTASTRPALCRGSECNRIRWTAHDCHDAAAVGGAREPARNPESAARRAVRTRGHFLRDVVARKLVYLALRRVERKWWTEARVRGPLPRALEGAGIMT